MFKVVVKYHSKHMCPLAMFYKTRDEAFDMAANMLENPGVRSVKIAPIMGTR